MAPAASKAHAVRGDPHQQQQRQQNIRRFRCTEEGCTKAFFEKSKLNTHVRSVHEGLRPFKCTVAGCGKDFTARSSLNMHLRSVHERARPFPCKVEGCDKAFATRDHLKTHMRCIHDGSRPFTCAVAGCGSSFAERGYLNKHVRSVHEGLRPYKCTVEGCERDFTAKHSLLTHVRGFHNGNRPFHCAAEGCGKSFAERGTLARHVRNVHEGVRPYKCTAAGCGKAFSQGNGLTKHMQSMHSGSRKRGPPPTLSLSARRSSLAAAAAKPQRSTSRLARGYAGELKLVPYVDPATAEPMMAFEQLDEKEWPIYSYFGGSIVRVTRKCDLHEHQKKKCDCPVGWTCNSRSCECEERVWGDKLKYVQEKNLVTPLAAAREKVKLLPNQRERPSIRKPKGEKKNAPPPRPQGDSAKKSETMSAEEGTDSATARPPFDVPDFAYLWAKSGRTWWPSVFIPALSELEDENVRGILRARQQTLNDGPLVLIRFCGDHSFDWVPSRLDHLRPWGGHEDENDEIADFSKSDHKALVQRTLKNADAKLVAAVKEVLEVFDELPDEGFKTEASSSPGPKRGEKTNVKVRGSPVASSSSADNGKNEEEGGGDDGGRSFDDSTDEDSGEEDSGLLSDGAGASTTLMRVWGRAQVAGRKRAAKGSKVEPPKSRQRVAEPPRQPLNALVTAAASALADLHTLADAALES